MRGIELKRRVKEKCRLCRGSLQFKFKANGCELAECAQCGFVQVIKTNEIEMYKYDESYFTSSKYKDNNALWKEYTRRKEMLIKYCDVGSRILERGCATGEFVRFISDMYQADGEDVSVDAISIAKKKYVKLRDNFWCITEQRKYEKGYDAVCLWDVIEHIPNPYESLSELKAVMKKGGYVFISTPNIGAVFARVLKSKWPFMTPPEHLCFFSQKSIGKLAELLDMDIVEWKSRGKWANVGFIFYKFNRVSSIKIPDKIVRIFQTTFMAKLNIYVPTHDIQYVVLKNNE
jgi:2-polyprenyl-3-methyl-5-hydroxy-6-metoxy-1,4-benzoquinol methylase